MSQQIWYVYQQQQQLGPYEEAQIKQFLTDKIISQDAFLFKAGWEDWRPLSDCLLELGLATGDENKLPLPPQMSQDANGRKNTRMTITGRIIIHNSGQMVIGSGVNISTTGIFVETVDRLFRIGETLKITCKVQGIQKPFNATAKVVRFNESQSFRVGYGLEFQALDQRIYTQIQKLIADQSQSKRAG